MEKTKTHSKSERSDGRKRRNRGWLVALVVFIVLASGAALMYQVETQRRLRTFIQWGDTAVAQGRDADAVQDYTHALDIAGPNADPDLKLKCGDAYYALRAGQPDFAAKAAGYWNDALTADPNDLSILHRVFDYDIGQSHESPSVVNFAATHDIAERIFAIDPTDERAGVQRHVAVLGPWLAGLTDYTDDLDPQRLALAKLVADHPEDSDAVLALGQTLIRRSKELDDAAKPADAATLLASAKALCRHELDAQSNNTGVCYAVFTIIAPLGSIDDPSAAAEPASPQHLAAESIADARGAVKPADAEYAPILLAAARWDGAHGARTQAEQTLTELNAKYPNNPTIQLALAGFMQSDPHRIPEALALLDADGASTAPAANLTDAQRAAYAEQIASLRIDDIANAVTPAQRVDKIAAATKACAAASALLGDVPESAKLAGRLAFAQQRYLDAIANFDHALSMTASNQQPDADTAMLLARAFTAAQEPTQAIAALRRLLDSENNLPQAQLMLAQLLAGQDQPMGSAPDARHESSRISKDLESRFPNDPDVLALRVELLTHGNLDPSDVSGDAAAALAKADFAKLSESTEVQQLFKAHVALAAGWTDQAIALLMTVRRHDPANAQATATLAGILVAQGKRDEARALVADALRADPNNRDLENLSVAINQPPETHPQPPDAAIVETEVGDSKADPALLSQARAALAAGDAAAAMAPLRQALQGVPDDAPTLALLFDASLQLADWDSAAKYAQRLTDANADQCGGATYQIRLDLARHDDQQAVQHARALSQSRADVAISWLLLGQALQQSGSLDEATESYRRALSLHPHDRVALRGVIDCCIGRRRFDEALDALHQARVTAPDDAGLADMEFDVELQTMTLDALSTQIRSAYQAAPHAKNNIIALARIDLHLVAALKDKAAGGGADAQAAAAERSRYLDEAVQTMDAALVAVPDDYDFARWDSAALLANGNPDAARRVLVTLAQSDRYKSQPSPFLLLAELDAELKNPQAQADDLRNALSRTPQDMSIALRLADVLAAQGNAGAVAAALAPFADRAAAQQRIVEIDLSAKNPDAAERFVQARLANSPNNARLQGLLGSVLAAKQQWDAAGKIFDGLIANDPRNADALLRRGLLRLNRPDADLAGATSDLSQVTQIDPTLTQAQEALSEAYRRAGDFVSAAHPLEVVLDRDPLNVPARQNLILTYANQAPPAWDQAVQLCEAAEQMPELRAMPDWSLDESRIALARGDASKAQAQIAIAEQLAPDRLDVQRQLLKTQVAANDSLNAIALASKIIAANPNAWWAYVDRAKARKQTSDAAGAGADFAAALAAADTVHDDESPATIAYEDAATLGRGDAIDRIADRAAHDPHWLLIRTDLLWAQGRQTEAASSADALMPQLASLPARRQIEALRLAGAIYSAQRPTPQPEKAYDALRMLVQREPNDVDALNNLACVLLDQFNPPRPTEALIYSTRAYGLMSASTNYQPAVADTHAWALTRTNQAAQAIVILQNVIPMLPLPDVHYHMAEAYLAAGEPQRALPELATAQSMIDAAQQAGQPIDPALESHIADARTRAQAAGGSQANTGQP